MVLSVSNGSAKDAVVTLQGEGLVSLKALCAVRRTRSSTFDLKIDLV